MLRTIGMPNDYTGSAFVRSAIAKALAQREKVDPVALAASRWGRDSDVVGVLKAGVSGGSSSAGNWGHELSDAVTARTEFLDLVRPLTVLGKLENLRQVAANVPYVATATGSTAYWTGQGKAVKVSPLAFSRATMAPLKIGALVVLTNTLLSDSKPESEQLVKRDLVAAVATLSDVTLLDPTNAGISGSTPAAITHGAPTITSSGDVAEDLAAAVDAFAGNFATAAWVMAPRAAAQIVFASGGRGIGADLGMRGGTLLGLPAIVSAARPSIPAAARLRSLMLRTSSWSTKAQRSPSARSLWSKWTTTRPATRLPRPRRVRTWSALFAEDA